MKQAILNQLLGPGEPSFFIAGFIFAMVGVLISLLISSSKRDISNPNTPNNFSWSYLIIDNGKRILLALLLILITLRFSNELIGANLTMWGALLIGLGWDRLAAYLKDKGMFEKKDKP
jgi:hypothetical protein